MPDVSTGDFTLTTEHRKFKQMLGAFPRFASYWHFQNRECDLEAIERDIGAMSRTEQIMLRFFVGVWLHKNRLELDFTDLAGYLDKDNLQVIIDWLTDPVWP